MLARLKSTYMRLAAGWPPAPEDPRVVMSNGVVIRGRVYYAGRNDEGVHMFGMVVPVPFGLHPCETKGKLPANTGLAVSMWFAPPPEAMRPGRFLLTCLALYLAIVNVLSYCTDLNLAGLLIADAAAFILLAGMVIERTRYLEEKWERLAEVGGKA